MSVSSSTLNPWSAARRRKRSRRHPERLGGRPAAGAGGDAGGSAAKVVRHDPGAPRGQNLPHDREDRAGPHVLDRLGVDDRAEASPEPAGATACEHVFETAFQDRDFRVARPDVGSLEAVRGQAGDLVPGGVEETQHPAHPGACVEHRFAGAVDPLQQLLGVAELGALKRGEADRLAGRVRVVEVPVVQKVARQHPVVEKQLGVGAHGRDAAVRSSAANPADDVMRQQRAAQDLLQDPAALHAGASLAGGRGSAGWGGVHCCGPVSARPCSETGRAAPPGGRCRPGPRACARSSRRPG